MTEETKHEKFLRIRDLRVPKAVHAIELLANLGSHHYEFNPAEAQARVGDLQAAVDNVAGALGVVAASLQVDDASDDMADEPPVETAAPAGKTQSAGAMDKPFPEGLTRQEEDHIFRIARELDRAINAVQDGKGWDAIKILTGLTTA